MQRIIKWVLTVCQIPHQAFRRKTPRSIVPLSKAYRSCDNLTHAQNASAVCVQRVSTFFWPNRVPEENVRGVPQSVVNSSRSNLKYAEIDIACTFHLVPWRPAAHSFRSLPADLSSSASNLLSHCDLLQHHRRFIDTPEATRLLSSSGGVRAFCFQLILYSPVSHVHDDIPARRLPERV